MIYKGISPILAAVLVVAFTTIVTMCMVDGITKKSVAAMLGTVIGVVFSGAFALIFGQVTSITGYNVSDIENLVYVGMSIASTLNELKEQNPQMMTKELFQSGMNVGRDMMGTMTNTLILAFTGGSINTLVFIFAYNYEYQQVINMYSVGIEIMQGLSSSLGVIMAVPVTSWIAAFLYSKNQK